MNDYGGTGGMFILSSMSIRETKMKLTAKSSGQSTTVSVGSPPAWASITFNIIRSELLIDEVHDNIQVLCEFAESAQMHYEKSC